MESLIKVFKKDDKEESSDAVTPNSEKRREKDKKDKQKLARFKTQLSINELIVEKETKALKEERKK